MRLGAVRRLALGSILAVVAVPMLAVPASGASGADWPQARASAAHRGWNKNETTISTAKVSKLRAKWATGVAINGEYGTAEAVVAGGRLFTFTVTGTYETARTTLVARDAVTAKALWTRTFEGGIRAAPAVAGGRLYLATPRYTVANGVVLSAEYQLWALNPSTGAKVWMRSYASDEPEIDALAVDGNRIALVHWFDVGYYRAWLWSAEGVLKATWTSGEYDFWAGNGPTISNGVIYLLAANEDGGFTEAYSPAGKPLTGWRSVQMGQAPQLPAAAGDLVYWADKTSVVVTDTLTGKAKEEMRPTTAEGHFRDRLAPAVDGQRLYLVYRSATTNVPTLTAFNRFTGARVWSRTIGAVMAPPTVANGVVFAAEGAQGVAAYAATTGAELWRQPGVANSSPPVVANGRLYVGWRSGSDQTTPAPVMMFGL